MKRVFSSLTIVFGIVASLIGCSANLTPDIQSAAISLQSLEAMVRTGGTTPFSAMQNGQPINGGTWAVLGGAANGSIGANGVYVAPAVVPDPNVVSIAFTSNGSTTTGEITILNPQPVITSVTPDVVFSTPRQIVVVGSGFIPGSTIVANSAAVATTFIDTGHLAAIIAPPSSSSINIAVNNPDPGGSTSSSISISEAISFTVTPAILSGGSISVTLTGSGFPPNSVVLLDGTPITVTSASSSVVTATGFLAPWKRGAAVVGVAADATSSPLGVRRVPIAPTAVSFDVAARFSTQAAFGPRPDVVLHIQKIGLEAFIKEQLSLPGVATYDPTQNPRTAYLRAIQGGNSLLRLRLALALQSFIVSQGTFEYQSVIPYEETLERDSTRNFRQLMTDIASDASMGQFLNLTGNNYFEGVATLANQNFARELMQLFTLGPNLLNDDGSLQLDANGNPIPTYSQADVVGLSQALTGWNLPTIVNPAYTAFEIDYSQPLSPNEGLHDWNPKTIIGGVVLPFGQGIQADRTASLDAIFQHPNLPPYVSRILIQRLVKSGPSPAYVQRISKVFEDDGTGVRGNLSAVVTAILLDPEARSGDTNPSPDDGFVQEPLLSQIFVTTIIELPILDDEPSFDCDSIGEPWWYSSTVFGYYSPNFNIPGTTINSPEFQLFNNITATVRSELLWGTLTGTYPGYGQNTASWLYTNFTTVPDLMDAIDHLAFHGQMPAAEKAFIISYCQQMSQQDINSQFQSALFLALNSDSFTVSH